MKVTEILAFKVSDSPEKKKYIDNKYVLWLVQ